MISKFYFALRVAPILGSLLFFGCRDSTHSSAGAPRAPEVLLPMGSSPQSYGYIDQNGEFILKPQWRRAKNFQSNFAFVLDKQTDKWAIISTLGKIIHPPQYDDVDSWDEGFHNGLLAVKKNGFWGFLNLKLEVQIPFVFHDVGWFSEGLCEAKSATGKYGYIDIQGEWRIQPKYDLALPFSGGLAVVSIGGKNDFINCHGIVIPLNKSFQPVDCYHEGLALAKRDEKLYFINTDGEPEIGPYDDARDFQNGLARVKKKGLWGIIDRYENVIVDFQYTQIYPFSEGLAGWQGGGNCGYFDQGGSIAILFKSKSGTLGPFQNGFARIVAGGNEMYIKRSGSIVARRGIK